MQASPHVVFITGASCAGKTTTLEALRVDTRCSHLELIDLDQGGVPEVARDPWIAHRTGVLLQQAVDRGGLTVIAGVIPPSAVVEAVIDQDLDSVLLPIWFYMLDVEGAVLDSRLIARLGAAPKDLELVLALNRQFARRLRHQVALFRRGVIYSVDERGRFPAAASKEGQLVVWEAIRNDVLARDQTCAVRPRSGFGAAV